MSRSLPQSILETHVNLAPPGLVTLFEITVPGQATIYLSPDVERIWLGNIYEFLPCVMSDISYESNGKLNRPKFTVANPEGLFSADVSAGRLDNAEVARVRLLEADLEANLDFAVRDRLTVGRIVSLTNQLLVLELRDSLDGNQFQVPARRYMPPEFPHVQLS